MDTSGRFDGGYGGRNARLTLTVVALLTFACGDAGTTTGAGPADDATLTLPDRTPTGGESPPPDALPFLDLATRPEAGSTDARTGPAGDGGGGAGGGSSGDDLGAGGGAGDALVDAGDECEGDLDCSDGFFCNGFELCVRGACRPAPRSPCADDIPCTSNLCDEEADLCEVVPDDDVCAEGQICDAKVGCFLPIGCTGDADCDDTLPCNGRETCVDRVCQPGNPVLCDDAVTCTIDRCDDATGDCRAVPDHSACLPGELCSLREGCAPRPPCVRDDDCDDGIFCNGQETCDVGTGLCAGGPVPAVDDGVDCTLDACNEDAGTITHTPRNNRCQDARFCNGAEICHPVDGCQQGAAPVLNDGVACTTDTCDEDADFIVHAPDDAACDDGLFCNGEEICDPQADCRPGEPVQINDGVGCTIDSCSEVERAIVHRPDDGRCSDGLFCNGDEICDPVEDCQAGEAVPVDDGLECTDDVCDEGARTVRHSPAHGRCDDGRTCNGVEICVPDVGCTPGPVEGFDDGIPCTIDACDPATDAITHVPDDAVCSNGLFCDGSETCDAARGCLAGRAPLLDDGIGCTQDTCDEAADRIVHAPVAARCDDALFCNGAETCDPAAGCRNGTPPELSDGVPCTVDACDEANDRVIHTADDARCSDGLFCNGAETCDAIAGCRNGAPPIVDDGVACTADACNENTDRVDHAPDNARCADANVCDGAEVCDAVAGCREGPRAQDGTPCGNPGNVCTAGVCGPGGVAPNYTGRFNVDDRIVYACTDILIGLEVVSVNIAQFVFNVNAGRLNITPPAGRMVENPAPVGPNFTATLVIAGGCTETYTLSGTFSDNDHWCGTFSIDFNGAQCGLSTCVDQTFDVCGTRAP